MMDHRRRFSAFVAHGHDPRPTIVEALEFVRAFLPHSALEERAQIKLLIVVEELVANTLRHGGRDGDVAFCFVLEDQGEAVAVELEDDAPPFDPVSAPEFTGPDMHTGGGVGLAIIRTWGETITYTRHDDRNRVRLTVR